VPQDTLASVPTDKHLLLFFLNVPSVSTHTGQKTERLELFYVTAILKVKYCLNSVYIKFNPLTLQLNPSAQCCLTRFFTGDFAS
jgi:hypothetical protein